MKLIGKTELTKRRDKLRELHAGLTEPVKKLNITRAAVPLLAGVPDPKKRREMFEREHKPVKAAWDKAVAEATSLSAPLAALREVDTEADQRRITREEVLTEQWVRTARHVAPYEPREYQLVLGDHRAAHGDVLTNATLNAAERDRALHAELLEELRGARVSRELASAKAPELARRALAAAASGDGGMLGAVWREHESRTYANTEDGHAQFAAVDSAVHNAIKAIPLPPEWVEELQLLDELVAADHKLRDLGAEIERGEPSPVGKAHLVDELGGAQGYMEQKRRTAEEVRIAAPQRAVELIQQHADKLVTDAPVPVPTATPPDTTPPDA